jgi:serine/threonine-protein kinase
VWAHSGRELFYRDEENRLMAVPVDISGPAFRIVGTPAPVFNTIYAAPGNMMTFDVSPDDQRFLMLRSNTDPSALPRMIVVLNWIDELNRRMAAGK